MNAQRWRGWLEKSDLSLHWGGPNVSQRISHLEITRERWESEGINIEVIPAGSSRAKDQPFGNTDSRRARAKWQRKRGREAFVLAGSLWTRRESEIKAQSIRYQVNKSVERILMLQRQENADGHFLLLNNSSLVRQGQASKLTGKGEYLYYLEPTSESICDLKHASSEDNTYAQGPAPENT